MKYTVNTWYWLKCDDGSWAPIFFNIDNQFLVGSHFFNLNDFCEIFTNEVIKAIMPNQSN